MADYSYVDNQGAVQPVTAPDANTAIATAPQIDPHSGVVTPPLGSGKPAVAPTAPVTPPAINRSIYGDPATAAPAPKSADQIQNDMIGSAQGEINSLNQYAADQLAAQKVVNDKNDRSTASISTLTGLGGSTEANVQQQKTTDAGIRANKAITDEAQAKIQTLLGNIRQSALAESHTQFNEARLNEADRATAQANKEAEAAKNLKNISASGVTFDGLKAGDPQSFAYLSKVYGGDDALRGAFLLNTPQDQILDKKIVGDHYVVSKQNPVTGKISVENMQIPGLPPDYSKTVDLGDRIMFYDPNNPDKRMYVTKGIAPKAPTGPGKTPKDPSQAYTAADGKTTISKADIQKNQDTLKSEAGSDHYVNPATFQDLYDSWHNAGYSDADFVKAYPPKNYVNPKDNPALPPLLRTPVKSANTTTNPFQ